MEAWVFFLFLTPDLFNPGLNDQTFETQDFFITEFSPFSTPDCSTMNSRVEKLRLENPGLRLGLINPG